MNKKRVGRQPEYYMVFRCLLRGLEIIERLSMTFTANGKMRFSFCQNMYKLDLSELLSCLLTRYIEEVLKRVRQVENINFHAFVARSCLLFAIFRKRNA